MNKKNFNNKFLVENLKKYSTFSEILHFTAERVPEKIFLIQKDTKVSFKEFNNLVNQCCNYFESLELREGDVISLVLPNSIDFLIIYFAAIRSRIVINPFPFHMFAQDILNKLDIINPVKIFSSKKHTPEFSKSKYQIINVGENKSFIDHLSIFKSQEFKVKSIIKDKTAVLYYSSGTTGNPKIIEYSYKSMVETQLSMLRDNFTNENSIHLCVLPLGHTASLRYTIKQSVCTGSTVVLYDSFWKIKSNFWKEITKYKATFVEIVPTILITILNTKYIDFDKSQKSSLDFIGCGSAYLPVNVQKKFEEKFGVTVANLYGLSETGATHFDNPKCSNRIIGSIGKPFDIFTVKIFKENRQEASTGEIGEIGVKGPGLLKGYLNNQKLFNQSFHEGFFLTGDLGMINENDVNFFVDRKKDLIIKGGINIVPSEIDEIISTYPGVEEVATIGQPDLFFGESVKSYVTVKNNSSVDTNKIINFCIAKIGEFKSPSIIELVDKLPKGPSGKILKRELRERAYK